MLTPEALHPDRSEFMQNSMDQAPLQNVVSTNKLLEL